MNEQLPPVERSLADQLARRSAGRPPAGLLDDVLSAVDATPSAPVVRLAAFRRNPRVSGALVGLAAVVVLVAALAAVPALRNAPPAATTLPTDRALTTAELAALMSGPALPVNTAFVAEVTIQPKPDVCPMNRYPTLGIVEGMPSQVCVMTGSVNYRLEASQIDKGVFAFRYLAPGVLGLLGKITTPSSGLAFKVADNWPLEGKTFIVDGWLGNSRPAGVADSCAEVASAGDVLSPEGTASCPRSQDWLADSATPAAIESPAATALADRSMDPVALFGDARLVGAYGARQIDGIDEAHPDRGPVRGRYVVKSQTGACPGLPAVSSRGCAHWVVVAKLADNLPIAQATPTPPVAPTPGYPTDRALTTAELGRLLDSGSLKTYDTVVADITLGDFGTCPLLDSFFPLNLIGSVAGLTSPTCVYASSVQYTPGHAVLRVIGNRTLGYMGTVPDAASGKRLAYAANETWPDGFFLVHGWLGTDTRNCGDSGVAGTDGGANPLAPAYKTMCVGSMTATKFDPSQFKMTGPTPAGGPRIWINMFDVPGDGKLVDTAPVFEAPHAAPVNGTVEGTYLVRRQTHTSVYGGDQLDYYALARLAEVMPPAATPTAEPPTTPVPEPTAMTPLPEPTATPDPEGAYPSERALGPDELARALTSSMTPNETVVAHTTVATGASCGTVHGYQALGRLADAGLEDVCVVGSGNVKLKTFAGTKDGIYVFRILDAHTVGLVDNVAVPMDKGIAYRADEALPDDMPDGYAALVHGWLVFANVVDNVCTVPTKPEPLNPVALDCSRAWLSPTEQPSRLVDPATAVKNRYPELRLPWLGEESVDPATNRDAVYVLRKLCQTCSSWEVLSRVDPIVLPPATASATPPPSTTAPSPTAAAAAKTVLWGSGNRPLTVAEFSALSTSNPTGLEGHVVIAKGPIPGCVGVITTACPKPIAGEGYWVLRVDHGKTSLVGKLSTPKSGFMWTVEELNVFDVNSGAYVVVDGDLLYDANCEPEAAQCSTSEIAGKVNVIGSVNKGAYEAISGGSTGSEAIPGPFLVHLVSPYDTVLGRLETVTP